MASQPFAVALAALVLCGAACKPRDGGSAAQLRAVDEAPAGAAASPAQRFRDTLFGCLKVARPADFDAMRHLVAYLPTDKLNTALDADSLDAMDTALRAETPSGLFKHGEEVPDAPRAMESIDAALVAHPVTVVVVPGVFGEFIETRAFDEVFSRGPGSAFGKEWAAKLAANPAAADERFSLPAEGPVKAGLDELLSVGSIDDQDGHALVKVVLLNTATLSLESLGESAAVAATFSRRLDKFFGLVGLPDAIALVGYSRGAMVALDMMASGTAPWLKNVRGVVSLGGVVFGSALADASDEPGSKSAVEVAALTALRDGLQDSGSAFASNSLKWGKFLAAMAKLEGSGVPSVASLSEAFSDFRSTDIRSGGKLVLRLWREFGLTKPFSGYAANIRRFKRLVTEMLVAVDGLKTPARLAWWHTHHIPVDGVRYYTLAGTMDDEGASELGNKLVTNPYSFDAGTPDFKALLASYKEYVKASGALLNDSQVSIARAYVAPRVVAQLTGQTPRSALLGVLGSHHWGLALPIVRKVASGALNPFPREALLKALAATVADDLAE